MRRPHPTYLETAILSKPLQFKDEVGIVIIGRNEGQRLQHCLESARNSGSMMVYVDSGSTDDSVACARAMKSEIVELDASRPFSAARARNEGFEQLRHRPGTPNGPVRRRRLRTLRVLARESGLISGRAF